nr:hypothetical protein [Romeria gracilis]
MPVHQVVTVDCDLPGCPPDAERIKAVLAPCFGAIDRHYQAPI